MEPSDEEIIALVLAGDRERFAILVDRHGRALLGWIGRRVRDPLEARELFQETWVRAFEGLAGLRERGRLRPWLIAIAGNTLAKGLRRPRPLSLSGGGSPAGDEERLAAPAGPSPLERRELRERIDRAVRALPPRQREVFELRALAGLSHAEVAAALGISEEGARASYYQAVRKLRPELEDEL